MSIKAKTIQPPRPKQDMAISSSEAQALGIEDTLVMVLFPRATWDEVVQLSVEMNVSSSEAIGAALLLLRARVDEEAGHVR